MYPKPSLGVTPLPRIASYNCALYASWSTLSWVSTSSQRHSSRACEQATAPEPKFSTSRLIGNNPPTSSSFTTSLAVRTPPLGLLSDEVAPGSNGTTNPFPLKKKRATFQSSGPRKRSPIISSPVVLFSPNEKTRCHVGTASPRRTVSTLTISMRQTATPTHLTRLTSSTTGSVRGPICAGCPFGMLSSPASASTSPRQ